MAEDLCRQELPTIPWYQVRLPRPDRRGRQPSAEPPVLRRQALAYDPREIALRIPDPRVFGAGDIPQLPTRAIHVRYRLVKLVRLAYRNQLLPRLPSGRLRRQGSTGASRNRGVECALKFHLLKFHVKAVLSLVPNFGVIVYLKMNHPHYSSAQPIATLSLRDLAAAVAYLARAWLLARVAATFFWGGIRYRRWRQRRRSPQHQAGDQFIFVMLMRAGLVHFIQQSLKGNLGQLVLRHLHGGERWNRKLSKVDVVESNH